MKREFILLVTTVVASIIAVANIEARDGGFARANVSSAAAIPMGCSAEHNVGNMRLMVSNNGTIGDGYAYSSLDFFTGQPITACAYPSGSETRYIFMGALWIGATVGDDTLVTVAADGWTGGREFYPDAGIAGTMQYRSNLDSALIEFTGAVSHQDLLAIYFDTCTTCTGLSYDDLDHRPHIPLGVRVEQTSHMWAYGYTEDFVIFDFKITNILGKDIRNGYIGYLVDADVGMIYDGLLYANDICGYLRSASPLGGDSMCLTEDALSIAWIADNGETSPLMPPRETPNVTGTVLLGNASELVSGFNWWLSNGDTRRDFGPQGLNTYRDLTTGGTGTPIGDRNKYWFLRNAEFDFDQIFTAQISPMDTLWQYPAQQIAVDASDGYDTRYLLSFGPFDLGPSETFRFAIAYVGGKNLHTDTTNERNLEHATYNPSAYYANLNFGDLIENARWASWIYDNPGIDSDSDGYLGEFTICEGETIWYAGDGVPDLVAADIPEAPEASAEGGDGRIVVRWNGWRSETTLDRFLRRPDFEGYNVYLKTNDSTGEYVVVASYDREDYVRYHYVRALSSFWERDASVLTVDELRGRYAPGGMYDSTWSPSSFTSMSPLIWQGNLDSVFYFAHLGCNSSKLGFETKIVKVSPDAPIPPYATPADVPSNEVGMYLNSLGQFKYYDYELTIESLLAGRPYSVAVSAFDYGPGDKFEPLSSTLSIVQPVVPKVSPCCVEYRGNIDCDPSGSCDIGDLTALLGNLFINGAPLCCTESANVDGSPDSVIDIADLTAIIGFLFLDGTAPGACQ